MELANTHFRQNLSNADGGMTAADYEALSKQTAAALQAAKASRDAETARTGCKKPLLNVGKKKKAYEECLANASKLPPTGEEAPYHPSYSPAPAKPFLKTPAGILTAVLGTALVVTGIVIAVKHFKK